MKRKSRVLRQLFIAMAFVVFTAAILSVPFLVGPSNQHAMLRGVTVLAAGTDRLTVNKPITLLDKPAIILEHGTISFPMADDDTSNDKTSNNNTLLSGRPRLALENAVLRVNLFSDIVADDVFGSENLTGEEAQHVMAPLLVALVSKRYKELSLRDCTILVARKGARPYRLENVQLDINIQKNTFLDVTGTFVFRRETLRISSRVGLGADQKSFKRFSLSAAIDGRLISAKLVGYSSVGSKTQINAKQAHLKFTNLVSVANWLGLDWPKGLRAQEFTAHGGFEWAGEVMTFQAATFSLGNNKATGTLSLSFAKSRPLLTGTLAARNLIFSNTFDSAQPTDSSVSLIYPEIWLEQLGIQLKPSMISLLRGFDADVRISADTVSGMGLKVGRSAATISLRDGKMLADIAEFELPSGGSGELQVSLDVTGAVPRMGVQGQMSDAEIGPAMALAFGHRVLSGRSNVSFDARGKSFEKLRFLESLNGKISIDIPDDAELALDLKKLFEPTNNNLAKTGWGVAASGTSTLRNLKANLSFQNGVAAFDDASAIFGKSAIFVDGEIEFPTKTVDLRISKTSLISGAIPSRLSGPKFGRLHLHATGNWGHPNMISPDHARHQSNAPYKNPVGGPLKGEKREDG